MVIRAFFFVTSPSALRLDLSCTTKRSVLTLPQPYLRIALLRVLAGTTFVLLNSMKARLIYTSSASIHPPEPSHSPVFMAAATLRMGACVPGGVPVSAPAACTEWTTPRAPLAARGPSAKYASAMLPGKAAATPAT